jgi:chromosome segregation protein
VASERDALVGELGALGAHQLVLSRTEAEAIEGKRLTLAEREQLESELEVLRARQLDSERRVDEAKNELGLKRNRLRALEELHRRLEGVGAGARALLSKHDPSVLGLVADRIEAPERCTSALAGLLAQWLECVVVSDLSKGLELLEQLKQSQRGRASILSQRPRYTSGGARGDWRTDPGVIGLLADELRYRDADEALVRALLGEAVLVESAADAVAFAERHPGATAVSLDGTVADPRGMVSGGGGDNAAFAILERQREMHSLSDEVSRLEASLAELLSTHNALRARRTELDTSLDRARQGVHEGELAHVTVQKDLARTSSEIQRLSARGEALELELGEIREGLSAAVEQQRASREELDELRSQLERARHDLAKVEAQAAGWRERVAGQATLVTERRVRLAQVKEQVEAARSATLRTGSSIAELGQRSQRLESEMHAAAEGFGQTAAQLIANREAIILAQATARDAHAALDQVKQVLEAARRDLSDGEAGLRQLREELELEEQDARKYEMTVQRLELERGHLLDSVRSRFRGLDLNRVVGDYHARPAPEEEHRRRIDELTQIIDRMGPVNLDARTEYRDTERRYQELSGQKTDIEQALADLERAIRHMNRESRKRFRDTFDAVNLQFKKSFARLFTGGRAELSLTDPEDLLGSGVDIVAQPPGKKLGTIELMSGGEKALTATALIFAILQHKPSPFCVLDEVDAPLDDANVARYNEVIREMTQHSQFILITHVQTTMRAVDVLWGVTMGEPGVSHLVSVKVNESAPARSDSRGPSVVHNAGENGKAKTQVA